MHEIRNQGPKEGRLLYRRHPKSQFPRQNTYKIALRSSASFVDKIRRKSQFSVFHLTQVQIQSRKHVRNKISQSVLFGACKTVAKMHAKRTWRRSKLSNYGNTRTKQQSRIIILVAIYRFRDNSHTKHPSHKH